jgi:hypothetical protein
MMDSLESPWRLSLSERNLRDYLSRYCVTSLYRVAIAGRDSEDRSIPIVGESAFEGSN